MIMISEEHTRKIKRIPDFEQPMRANRRVRKVSSGFFKQFIFCFVCVLVFCAFIYRVEIKSYVLGLFDTSSKKEGFEFQLPFSAKRQNLLLMGVDVSENKNNPFQGTRSDSIYLVSIAPHAKNVNVISIPRDSKVYIHGRQAPDKINHAFAYGGINTSIKTIEQTLGVRIDHYLVVSNRALIDFIDKIGGIDVYVEKDMHYNDNTANLHINLTKGMQHLDGLGAEGFIRYRKDGLGDIGRIRRQQWFLNALTEKMKDPAIILKIPEILKSLSKYVMTDLSAYELAQYASLLKTLDSSRIMTATLPGEPSQRGIISYWILDPEGVQDIVDKFVYGGGAKSLSRPLEAGILYIASEEERAKELQKELEANGVKVSIRQVKHLDHDHIAIHSFDIPDEAISALKSTVGIMKNKQTVYDVIGINKAARDFTIILAGSQK